MAASVPSPPAAGVLFAWILCAYAPTLSLGADGPPSPPVEAGIEVRVSDARGAPLAAVALTLRRPDLSVAATGVSDDHGRCRLLVPVETSYGLEALRAGFFPLSRKDVPLGATSVAIALVQLPDYSETVDVVVSGPGDDAPVDSASSRLGSRDVVDLPFAGSRDYRRALTLLPGVLEDASGQLHVSGSEPQQLLFLLDGFEVGDPATGMLRMRMAPEALRSLELLTGRFSVEHASGSGGVVSLDAAVGGERFRVAATDFFPSVTAQHGIRLDNWTPRLAWSGPLLRQRAWFSQSVEGEYHRALVAGAPAGANTHDALRLSHLAKVQVALAPRHLMTASFLWNLTRADHEDLTRFNPIETTVNRKTTTTFLAVRDRIAASSGMLIDLGLAVQRVLSRDEPLGSQEYVMRPGATSGNYYRWSEQRGDRLQAFARLTLPAREWHGRHQIRLGLETKPVAYRARVARRSIAVLGDDGRLVRTIEYVDGPEARLTRVETGVFAEDRWSLSDRRVLRVGLRSDWDSDARCLRFAPRVALALGVGSVTRLNAGTGLYYDAIPLDVLALPQMGQRTDVFFSSEGQPLERVETRLFANERGLQVPRTLNWRLGVERRLARALLASAEYRGRRATNGLTFLPPGVGSEQWDAPVNVRPLDNWRRERYDGVVLALSHSFQGDHSVSLSYVWSHARTNAALDFDLDMPILGAQAPAPLAWDARHRLLAHGFVPVVRSLDLAYTLEWRSGFPFSLTNREQALVERPNSRRLPAYFLLNVHLEQRVQLFGARWALRVGANDVTNRANPWLVDPNVDSPTFLAKDRTQHRSFIARIRFLGRN